MEKTLHRTLFSNTDSTSLSSKLMALSITSKASITLKLCLLVCLKMKKVSKTEYIKLPKWILMESSIKSICGL